MNGKPLRFAQLATPSRETASDIMNTLTHSRTQLGRIDDDQFHMRVRAQDQGKG